ncbi:hypothetical protein ARMGADRAFT_1092636 [Armillaria gallica]|uniref:Uncharacterized protein n=1 Tax=Armillaria gallica TaxID=47427 RepID=A0A2H3CAB2_ARMGA|nr:hypothetical protein ARMGADRAFT_1092636 [Armillaria gallica]
MTARCLRSIDSTSTQEIHGDYDSRDIVARTGAGLEILEAKQRELRMASGLVEKEQSLVPTHTRPRLRRVEQAECKDDSPEGQSQTMQVAPPSHPCYLALTQDMAVWLGTSCLSWRLETRIEERGSAPTASLTPRVPRRLSRPHPTPPASTAKPPPASVVHDLAGHPSPTLPRFHVMSPVPWR